jgi:serine/threonine-protein phosphatase 2A regulatory subunit B
LFVLTTNDKTVKLWKVYSTQKKEFRAANKASKNEKELEIPKIKHGQNRTWHHSLKRSYPNLHNYHINSISVCANGENFISSDDLRINLWHLENKVQAFNIIDLKPENFEELSEVITASQFHPLMDNQFIFSTSKGIIKLGDLRKSSVCDHTALVFEDKDALVNKNFFTEIVSSISDVTFSKNGRYIFSRDFLSVKVWDINMNNKPVETINIFEPLKSKLCELYENDCIFDKFSISSSPCSNYFLTGLFNNNFHIADAQGGNNMQYELNFSKNTLCKQIPKKFYEPLGSNYNFNRKVLKSAWHPTQNVVAIACLNSLFLYNAV